MNYKKTENQFFFPFDQICLARTNRNSSCCWLVVNNSYFFSYFIRYELTLRNSEKKNFEKKQLYLALCDCTGCFKLRSNYFFYSLAINLKNHSFSIVIQNLFVCFSLHIPMYFLCFRLRQLFPDTQRPRSPISGLKRSPG